MVETKSNVDLLAAVSETLATARTIEQLTQPLLELLELVTGLESTYLTRIDLEAGTQDVLFSRNSRTIHIPAGISVPWNDTLCKRALEEGRSFTNEVSTCWADSQAARALGIETYASTPIYLKDGALFGTLCAASAQRKPFVPDAQQVLTLFSALIAQHIERERLLERLQEANAALEAYSFHDALTGLPNRRFVVNELRRLAALAMRTETKLVVAFIDLDDFKAINDRHGHDAGDAFLCEVGRRLSDGLRASDIVGRLGGDEFVVAGLATESEGGALSPERFYGRLDLLLQGRFDLPQCCFDYPGASIGVFEADPLAMAPEEMLRNADRLMYADKKERRLRRGSAGTAH